MQFLVKTLKADSGIGTTVVDAASRAEAVAQARALGQAVLSAAPVPLLRRLQVSGSSRFPLLLFSQELLSLLESGITIVEAIETLAEKEGRPAVRDVLTGMVAGLREGLPFSAVLEGVPRAFPALYVATVRASERTSGLDEALGRYIVYATQLETLRGRLVSAAIYPVLLLAVSGLVILFLMGYVVPRFSHIYEDMGGDLPFFSRLLLNWGLAVEQYWSVFVGFGVALAVGAVNGGGRVLMQKMLRLLWRVPAVGERMRVFQLARLYRTLGMLLRGGIAIVPALDMVAGLLSIALQTRLASATQSIRQGNSISTAFEVNGLTTAVALRMLRVGERAGNMGEMMERVAAFHDDEMARWAEWVTRLLGPMLMLLMGLVIGAVVILMYLPIFQLADSIQ
ncbi:type II secretion system F family protein [Rhodoferax sp. U11-2br]|uniref:type II secretion system F family protein n=1 Tax=Rhodoferax sp. U11-2br TaxID=2838878 RepID=UPI001BE6F497|nr:type II secretion system F family protein [Rhodoferax sp. U11-2br]MBT3067996.1 type II secretion system F family protein [Rhodoferax sp. U11-2br]